MNLTANSAQEKIGQVEERSVGNILVRLKDQEGEKKMENKKKLQQFIGFTLVSLLGSHENINSACTVNNRLTDLGQNSSCVS